MWVDLGFFGDDGCFHIHGVTGPDEYTAMVDDNAYTNLMARLNLRYAAADGAATPSRAARTTSPACRPSWCWTRPSRTSGSAPPSACTSRTTPTEGSRRRTPRSSRTSAGTSPHVPAAKFPLLLHHHPLTMYRRQVLKQADVVMAMFLLGNEFSVEQKRRNFDYYDPITTGDSSLSASIQSIVASEIGEEHAACDYFDHAVLDGSRRRGRQRLRRCAHRLGGRALDGPRVRLRRRPRLRRPSSPSTPACPSGSARSGSRCASTTASCASG